MTEREELRKDLGDSNLYTFTVTRHGAIRGSIDIPYDEIKKAHDYMEKQRDHCPIMPRARFVFERNHVVFQTGVCNLGPLGIGCTFYECDRCDHPLKNKNQRDKRDAEIRADMLDQDTD